jgi:Phosphoserine phosphatase RsbU, N-terminal domain/GAF domain
VGEVEPVGAATAPFRAAYACAFEAYAAHEDEAGLRAAYELGRDAVERGLGLLDLALVHGQVVLTAVGGVSATEDAQRVTRAAGMFLLEALSAFEMVRRAVAETRLAITLERRQAAMLRQLSTLLADTSLALSASSSLEEVLQLVAEEARELTAAAWCVARARTDVGGRPTALASSGTVPARAGRLADEAMAAAEARPQDVVVREDPTASLHLAAAPFAALDGRPIGGLVAARDRPFDSLELALLVHIAQMTAAGLERALRYAG